MPLFIPRRPWPPDFPDVTVHCGLQARNGHSCYGPAKSGDPEAAKRLVEDLMPAERIEQIRLQLGGHWPFLVPVTADEVSGFNAIPDAMAQLLSRQLNLVVPIGNVVQVNKVGHTKADGWHRLVTPAIFDGDIIRGKDYLLVE